MLCNFTACFESGQPRKDLTTASRHQCGRKNSSYGTAGETFYISRYFWHKLIFWDLTESLFLLGLILPFQNEIFLKCCSFWWIMIKVVIVSVHTRCTKYLLQSCLIYLVLVNYLINLYTRICAVRDCTIWCTASTLHYIGFLEYLVWENCLSKCTFVFKVEECKKQNLYSQGQYDLV